jgi:hypothetical protein
MGEKLHGSPPQTDVEPAGFERLIVRTPNGAFASTEIVNVASLSDPVAGLAVISVPLKDIVAPVRFFPLTAKVAVAPGDAPPGLDEFTMGAAAGKTVTKRGCDVLAVSALNTRIVKEPGLTKTASGRRQLNVAEFTKVDGML